MKYYIYHIKGKKIGCSEQPHQRVDVQKYSNFEILEEHSDIIIASKRELELQKQYGYKIDKIPYYQTINNLRSSLLKKLNFKKSCVAIDVKTNKIVKEFNSLLSAALWVGKNHSAHIRRCCLDPTKTAYGYKWRYK